MEVRPTSGELAWKLLKYAADHPVKNNNTSCAADGTDEEVREFINIFMMPAKTYNKSITSYGLKHAAERTIGYVFHGSEIYHYVSNEQFKKVMDELGYESKRECAESPNMYYKFKWVPGAEDLFDAFGVYGCTHHKPLNSK